ncbi:uncharacterized protein L203_103721 [Cryptococcus depauperatus CBS 7841]|uniref:Uncharacterized protein n=1 Tax=Cryptococcus depauperatus CBS 7841 TaxID=1295531 RepID=A0A1E3IGF1_9TREE|nr:hypothetical protein L203_03780 [Cryptococcus depauperatus CBS 7841]
MLNIEIDNLTLLLLILLLTLAIYHRFLSTPSPLVHPLLLGKQSEISAVRKSGESGVYRAWATGHGTPLAVRPANTVKTVQDVARSPKEEELREQLATSKRPEQRCILDIKLTDEALAEIVRLIPLGLSILFPSSPASISSIVTIIPPSSSTSLPLLLLSLSATPDRPLVILPTPRFFTYALTASGKAHPAAGIIVTCPNLLSDIIEQVFEDNRTVGVLVVGDPEREQSGSVAQARERGLNVHWWEEVWDLAESEAAEKVQLPDAHFNDVHSYYYAETEDLGKPLIVKATHLNVTAGITSLLALFPADKRPSRVLHDVVASAVRLDTPLGMTIALASIWNGAGFRMMGNHEPLWDTKEVDHALQLNALVDSEKDLPKPTILFITPKHHRALIDRLQYTYEAHPYAALAIRRKVHSIKSGYVDRDGLWDRVIFSGMRENVMGGVAGHKLRAVILVGDAPPPMALSASHLLLSLPLTRVLPSLYSSGPVFGTHFYDLQSPGMSHVLKDVDLWKSTSKTHSGPPASNVEVVLKGENIDLAHDEQGQFIEGRVWIRGPSVLERVDGGGRREDGWVDIEEYARVQTNGTFIIGGLAAHDASKLQ